MGYIVPAQSQSPMSCEPFSSRRPRSPSSFLQACTVVVGFVGVSRGRVSVWSLSSCARGEDVRWVAGWNSEHPRGQSWVNAQWQAGLLLRVLENEEKRGNFTIFARFGCKRARVRIGDAGHHSLLGWPGSRIPSPPIRKRGAFPAGSRGSAAVDSSLAASPTGRESMMVSRSEEIVAGITSASLHFPDRIPFEKD